MRAWIPTIAVVTCYLALAPGCKDERSRPGPDAAKVTSPRAAPVRVVVSTEPRHRPRLTLVPGLPGTPRPQPQRVGSLHLTAERCHLEGATFLSTRQDPALRAVEVLGRHLYAIDHRGAVLRFSVAPTPRCRLRLDKSWGTAGVHRSRLDLERLTVDGHGTLIASSYLGSLVVREGRVAYPCRARHQGHVALHPTGGWGLAGYSGSDVHRLVFGPTSCTGAVWHLTALRDDARRRGPFRLVSALGFQGDTILVGGSLALRVQGWHPHVAVAFDEQGRRRFQLGALTGSGPERLGWIRSIGACGSQRICVVDGTLRRLTLWDTKGRFLGAASMPDLLGVTTPWLTNLAVASPDRVYLAAGPGGTQAGMSEGTIFRVGGLAGSTP